MKTFAYLNFYPDDFLNQAKDFIITLDAPVNQRTKCKKGNMDILILT